MKTCSYCGSKYSDETETCPADQTPLGETPKTAPASDSVPHSIEHSSLSPEQMQQPWVTVARCGTLVAADVIAMKLRGAGMEAFLPDEYLMQADAFNFNAFGYVRVQVAPKDYEAAREFLAEKTAVILGDPSKAAG
jgi:hypothetical protein